MKAILAAIEASKSSMQVTAIMWSRANCGPCRAIKPEFDSLKAHQPHVAFHSVPTSHPENKAVNLAFNVTQFPTFTFYLQGKEELRLFGSNVDLMANLDDMQTMAEERAISAAIKMSMADGTEEDADATFDALFQGRSHPDFKKCAKGVARYISKAQDTWEDSKFKTINMSNKLFVKHVADFPGGIQALKAAGFKEKDGSLALDDSFELADYAARASKFTSRLLEIYSESEVSKWGLKPASSGSGAAAPAAAPAPAPAAVPQALRGDVASIMQHPAINNMMNNADLNAATSAMMAENPGLLENMMSALASGGDLQSVMSNPSVQAITQQMMSDPSIMAAANSMLGGSGAAGAPGAAPAAAAEADEGEFDDDDFMLQEALRLSMMEEESQNEKKGGDENDEAKK